MRTRLDYSRCTKQLSPPLCHFSEEIQLCEVTGVKFHWWWLIQKIEKVRLAYHSWCLGLQECGFLDGKILHRLQYIQLQACALKPDDMKYIGKRGGRTHSIPNAIWKYYAQLTSFSLKCSITWLHENQFCSAVWAVKLGLERAGLYAQLCHKQTHTADVTPAPAVSRISQEEGFSSSQGCP